MKISRETDGLRFVGECTPQSGFKACDIECAHCGRRIDPHSVGERCFFEMQCLQCHGKSILVRSGPSRLSGGKLEPLAAGVLASFCDYARLLNAFRNFPLRNVYAFFAAD
jgi:hypothetical protein